MHRLPVLLFTCVILHSPLVFSEPNAVTEKHEVAGLSIGALLGGLIAGPPGAFIGATGGLFYGNYAAAGKNKQLSLEQQLQEKTTALIALQEQLALQKATENNIQAVGNQQESRHTIQNLTNGFSFSIYFRTGISIPETSLDLPITDLAQLIRDVPSIRIELDAHADRRGNDSYNLALSRARANSIRDKFLKAGITSNRIVINANGERRAKANQGDTEGYIFDRRVDVRLTLDNQA